MKCIAENCQRESYNGGLCAFHALQQYYRRQAPAKLLKSDIPQARLALRAGMIRDATKMQAAAVNIITAAARKRG